MRQQFTFYRSFWEAVQELPPKDKTAVLSAICEYALDETTPPLSGVPKAIFALIKPTLDTAAKKAEIGKLGGSKAKAGSKQSESKTEANDNQTESKKESKKEKELEIENKCYISAPRTSKPTLDEVSAYCLERGNDVDPERWYAYYESNGWRVGKNPMKDWKAAVRTWERNGIEKPRQEQPKSFAQMWREMQNDEI